VAIVPPVSLHKTLALGSGAWLVLIIGLHSWLNLDLFRKTGPKASTTLKVGFLPVT
jgi:hypothetical protein